jgi:hypothetical protein
MKSKHRTIIKKIENNLKFKVGTVKVKSKLNPNPKELPDFRFTALISTGPKFIAFSPDKEKFALAPASNFGPPCIPKMFPYYKHKIVIL